MIHRLGSLALDEATVEVARRMRFALAKVLGHAPRRLSTVVRSSASALEPAAEQMARRLRVHPALLAGEPVRVRTDAMGGAGAGGNRETGRP